jgi:hypothetical protein
MAAEPDDALAAVQGERVCLRPLPGTEQAQPRGTTAIAGRDEELGLGLVLRKPALVGHRIRLGHAAIMTPAAPPDLRPRPGSHGAGSGRYWKLDCQSE